MDSKTPDTARSMPFSNLGQEQTKAMAALQKELLESYEQASRAWLDRVKAEVELWSQLAAKLTTTRTVPEAVQAYQQSVAQRMQMAAEDGRRLFEECQKISHKITSSLPNGPAAGNR
jgi:Phasin protein